MSRRAEKLLEDYRRKRDFAKTSEPSGTSDLAPVDGKALQFVVQKHDATRLHFDFRIELDGVLKSWAVTKGPSENPADKRLAVRVEDHPFDYKDFEGTIPDGEYGGGTVMIWDEGTWEPIGDPHDGLEAGDLKMRLTGKRLKGEYVLVHMKGRDNKTRNGTRENWLLIKHRDDFAREADGLTERHMTSIRTGRTMEAIAKGLKSRKKSSTPPKAVWHSEPEKAAQPAKSTRKRPAQKAKGLALPEFRAPQLATLVDAVPDGKDWLFEMKYDGYRCLAAISGGDVKLYTRTGKDWTDIFGRMVGPLSRVTEGSALIDGELCAFDEKGRTDFSALKAALSDSGPLVFFAFDLLERDGKDLARKPLSERKAMLRDLLGPIETNGAIQYSEDVGGNGQRVYEALCRDGYEGVIAKEAGAPYRHERTRSWLKVKCVRRQEFVIGGWSPSSRKKTFASLLIGTYEDGVFTYRGRVGTGFTLDSAHDLQKELDARARKTSPFTQVPRPIARSANWVTPELVAEIGFAEFTPDGVLRHPSFLGLRTDKPARDIGRETPVPVDDAEGKSNGTSGPKTKRKPRPKTADVDLSDEAGIAISEREDVKLTSPTRVVYPGQGVTKAEIVAYYDAVAERMLPHIAGRPLSLLRCPQGRAKYCFFQKHDTGGFPEALASSPVAEKSGEPEQYFHLDDLAGLIAGTQMNVLEWHIWGSRLDRIEQPDRLVFDIDPDEGLGFAHVRDAARTIRDVLGALDLDSFPLVSGGKGIHVVVPLKPGLEWPDAKAFAKGLATRLAEAEPDRFTAVMSKARRKGRLFIDYLRNERGSTAIAPFSLRSREGAPVAVPASWDELDGIEAANQFSLEDAISRARGADPWAGYAGMRQTLTKARLKAVS